MQFSSEDRTRSVYEDYSNTGSKNKWREQYLIQPMTSTSWSNPGTRPVDNFRTGIRDSSCYQFGTSDGDHSGEDESYINWCENEDQVWSEDGDDRSTGTISKRCDEWVCTECDQQVDGKYECSEVCESCNKEWEFCYCIEDEGYDSVS
jgi:hypothetical protein